MILVKVDTDENPASPAFGIQGIPAVKAFEDGEVVGGVRGAQPPDRRSRRSSTTSSRREPTQLWKPATRRRCAGP